MKKIFFLLTMLASVAAGAQNMQITPISATYTTSPVIKFKVEWTGARTYRHNTKVWVFVDYRKVQDNAPAGNWTRATVTVTPVVNSSPESIATLVAGNNEGFWLNGVDGNYSATVTLSLTLATGVTQFNWCAYGSDYPPNVVIQGNNNYTLHGSPPFVINGTTLPASQTTYSGTISSFTDATGAPGLFPAALNETTNEMGCIAGLVENANGICVTPASMGCTNNTLNLGTVNFTAGTEITIVGNGVSQIWSRPVTATGCQKTNYDGGTEGSSYADCRNNPNYAGNFYSGCAAVRYASQLCPPPWRLPSLLDAMKIARILNIPVYAWNKNNSDLLTNLLKLSYSGSVNMSNTLEGVNEYGAFWLNTYDTGILGVGKTGMRRVIVNITFENTPHFYDLQSRREIMYGNLVRCVRDN
ncbi:MAG: fibrobacter succinogenes major paralogous domain-containing protein [Prevotellaceae bacterium]|jgi:hypothetical protein|nr:fibrobacter succinogenes major paralogous domain-containing protein [Prevotellaceae bacterium]